MDCVKKKEAAHAVQHEVEEAATPSAAFSFVVPRQLAVKVLAAKKEAAHAAQLKVDLAAHATHAEQAAQDTQAVQAARKVQTVEAMRLLMEHMKTQKIEFEAGSWNIDDHKNNRPILKVIADILHKYDQVSLVVHGVQKGETKGRRATLLFDESYPDETVIAVAQTSRLSALVHYEKPITAQGRALACRDVLLEMGLAPSRLMASAEIGSIRVVKFIAKEYFEVTEAQAAATAAAAAAAAKKAGQGGDDADSVLDYLNTLVAPVNTIAEEEC